MPLGITHIDTISYNCLAADTIYLRISTSGCFQYRFYQNILSTGLADIEPNNTLPEATFVSLTDSITGRINYVNGASDPNDYFKIFLPQSDDIDFYLTYNNTSGSTSSHFYFYVYNGNGGLITSRSYLNQPLSVSRDTIKLIGQASDTLYVRTSSSGCFAYNVVFNSSLIPPVVANDNCADATLLNVGTSCVPSTFTNLNATAQVGIAPNPTCGFYQGADVWFKFVMPASGRVRIEKQNGSANIQLALYSGICGSMTELTCMQLDDDRTYHNIALAGQTVYLRAYSYNSINGGTFNLCVWEPPLAPNDYCDNSIALPVGNSCTLQSFTNEYATEDTVYSPQNPSCGFFKGGDVWFTVQMPASGRLRIEKVNGTANIQLALYSGSCGSLTELTCMQLDADRTYHNKFLAGQTLYLRAYSYNSEEGGTFQVCAWEPPLAAGDYCDSPIPLSVGSSCTPLNYDSRYSTSDTVYSPQNPSCGFYEGGDVWFSLVMPSTGVLTLTRANISGNLQMALYSGTCGNFTELACAQLQATINYSNIALAGQTLYLRGFGYNSEEGAEFSLCAWDPTCLTTITNVQTTDVSCSNLSDGSITITANCANCTGTLEYSIDQGVSYQASNVFNNVASAFYNIKVRDIGDTTCKATQNNVIVGNSGTAVTYYYDFDGDNFGRADSTAVSCAGAPVNFVLDNTDCNDNDINVWQDSTLYVDADGDGYDAGTALVCIGNSAPTGYKFTTLGSDCDDNNVNVWLGETWYLDADGDDWYVSSQYACGSPGIGWTNVLPIGGNGDCDDANANIHAPVQYYVDADGDGFGSTTTAMLCSLTAPSGYSTNNTDCDDSNANINAPIQYFVDADGDGFGSTTTAMLCSLTAPSGYSTNNTDCDDGNVNINAPIQYFVDSDGDGFGSTTTAMLCSLTAPSGFSTNNTDCDDSNGNINAPIQYFVDADGDGFGSTTTAMLCSLTAPSGYSTNNTDCDDGNVNINAPIQYFVDADGDGFGSTTTAMLCSLTAPSGYAINNTDCDDGNLNIWQDSTLYVDADGDGYDAGTAVICIGNSAPTGYKFTTLGSDCDDNNVNAAIGETWYLDADSDGWYANSQYACGNPGTGWTNVLPAGGNGDCDDANANIHAPVQYYVDADGDGFGSTTTAMLCSLTAPSGYSTNNTDCDDGNMNINAPLQYFVDADGDGFGSTTTAMLCSITAPSGYSTNNTDCDDGNVNINAPIQYFVDSDGDGFGSTATAMLCSLTAPSGYSTNNTDCDDSNVNINAPIQYFVDADGDGFGGTTTAMLCSLTAPSGYSTNNTDCDDASISVYPGAPEICGNGIDEDCVGGDLPCGGGGTCLATVTLIPDGLKAFWGPNAANPYIFYDGVTQWKLIQAKVTNGSGSYSYSWSLAGSGQLKPASTNSIYLFEPSGPTVITVTVTDLVSNSTCVQSISIGWDNQFNCTTIPTQAKIMICEGGVSKCEPWTSARNKIRAGTATLGNCPTKTVFVNEKPAFSLDVYPNPNSGQFNVIVKSQRQAVQIEIFDLNAKRLLVENMNFTNDIVERAFDLSVLPPGVYFIQVNDGYNTAAKKFVIRH